MEKAAEVNEEYKIDLESKIKEMAETEARLKKQLSSLKNNLTEENAKRIQEHERKISEMKEENEKKISQLEEDNNAVIIEDLKLLEKNRKEIEDLKEKSVSMKTEIESDCESEQILKKVTKKR